MAIGKFTRMTIELNKGIMEFVREAELATVLDTDYISVTLETMTRNKLGTAFVVDEVGKLVGVITDGDLRRRILGDQRPTGAMMIEDASYFMTTDFISISSDSTLAEALKIFTSRKIWDIPVVKSSGCFCGAVHLQDILPLLVSFSADE